MKLILFSILLLLSVAYCSNYLRSSNWLFSNNNVPNLRSKRQNSGWYWQNDDNNFRPRRYPQFNNDDDDDDFFVFDVVEDNNAPALDSFTTPRPLYIPSRATPIPVPGMGTTRSPCEDACLLTNQYNPVCGTDNVSYFSRERLFCAKRCGKNIEIKHIGKCFKRAQVV